MADLKKTFVGSGQYRDREQVDFGTNKAALGIDHAWVASFSHRQFRGHNRDLLIPLHVPQAPVAKEARDRER